MKRTCAWLVLLVGCSGGEKSTPSDVRYVDVEEGTGPGASAEIISRCSTSAR